MTHNYLQEAYSNRFNLKFKSFNPKRLWFSSDLHFGHKNVCKLCNRPFDSVNHMNQMLIQNWNSLVHPTDHVMFLGDLALCNTMDARASARKLNGIKYWLWGNHDNKQLINYCSDLFEWSGDYLEIKAGDQEIVLNHYPMMSWSGKNRDVWQLHGHCHGNLTRDPLNKQIVDRSLMLDVGVDCHDYKPISYCQVKSIMDAKLVKRNSELVTVSY